MLETVAGFWRDWSEAHTAEGGCEWSEAVLRSVITLKALAHFKTGGIIAAATTSLPEQLGGARNWDYRFCWLRDATITLYALLNSGFKAGCQARRRGVVQATGQGRRDERTCTIVLRQSQCRCNNHKVPVQSL